jgi:hypothetical protein
VGVLRRGKYVKGKRIGKGDLVTEVSAGAFCLLFCFVFLTAGGKPRSLHVLERVWQSAEHCGYAC